MGQVSSNAARSASGAPGAVNSRFYRSHDLVETYARSDLRPAEAIVLGRYRDDLSGSVLEIGCGSGRLIGPLLAIASQVHGIDISAEMVEHCRARFPEGSFERMDMRDVGAHVAAPFDAVIAAFNVIDALGEEERQRTLDRFHDLLAPGGLLVMSSHNAEFDPPGPVGEILHSGRTGDVRRTVAGLVHLPRRLANHRRLSRLEVVGDGYAIRNDVAHDFALLHYYITRDDQERQLAEHGFELLECLALDGDPVLPGEPVPDCPELHYLARRST